jgi:amino acid transporter
MNKKIGLRAAISIGIGGMVGGGIFAVLGLAVSIAKGGTPLAFFFAGLLALLTSYSYVSLSKNYPNRGGTVNFINIGFGKNIFSGALNNLLWLCYIIMLSLYASAFGSYAPNLLQITSDKTIYFHIYASAIILFATIINYYSITIVGKIETYAVVIKMLILTGFIIIGIYGLMDNPNISQLNIANWETPIQLFAGGMVIFVAYEGFELIANASPDIINPEQNIPKAYYYSVVFVIVLYIIIALVTIGSLPFSKIASAQDYVLAEAAKPLLGQTGFTIMTIAALISTFSAINASLYGGSRVNFEIAQDDELPHHFLSQFWNQPIGLLITSISTLVLVNILQLESISSAGSLGFLLIFAIVNLVGFKKHKQTKSNSIIPLFGFILCITAMFILIHQQFTSKKATGVLLLIGILIFCFIIEWLYKKNEKR